MKIRIKVTDRELRAWLAFLGLYVSPAGPGDGGGTLKRMVMANLAGLYHHLLMRSVIARKDYAVKVGVAEALAFQFLAERADPEMADVDRIAINRIVGIIDQKTK